MMRIVLTCLGLVGGLSGPTPELDALPRVIILTDISSLSAGFAEPDDGQSLIRFLLHANEFDVEGLIATSNLGHGLRTRPDLIRQVVEAYGRVQPRLREHDPRYPPVEVLRDRIKAGQPDAGPRHPIERSIGPDKGTDASDWIIQAGDRIDPRPLWILIWGGSADLAQALWQVRATRSPEQLERFVAELRVHAIGDQDSTGPWIREHFPNLWLISQQRAYRGMYRGGDPSLVSPDWVETRIHGHGPLADLYPNYNGGDIWSRTLGRVRGIKEGDTPSFLSIVSNGLGLEDHPELGSWGGRFDGPSRHLTDIPDTDLHGRDDPDPRMSSVYRWRPAFQADFQARLTWCVEPYERTNHPPRVKIAGERERTVAVHRTLELDASETSDPDGDPLQFSWSVYPLDQDLSRGIAIEGADSSSVKIHLSSNDLSGRLVPILLTVSDQGQPSLTRYGRVLVRVR
jgi:hypothetical protein